MNDADTTWALVVGIDNYDHVPALTGAVRDAGAVVEWLRRLGVADERILLHASPTDESSGAAQALNFAFEECTENGIFRSLLKLKEQRGSRLFVFLIGHGFYEPRGYRLFLTREAKEGDMANLGIDWLCRYLRSAPFARQFIFMDGCLNLPYSKSVRSRIKPGEHNGVELDPEVDGVAQWLAFGADLGQYALEINGRGLFTSSLLSALNLDNPHSLWAQIDIATGAYQFDLVKAINGQVSQEVREIAGRHRFTQCPGIHPLSGTLAAAVVATIPSVGTPVNTKISPQEAAEDVAAVMLHPEGMQWNRRVPSPPSTKVEVPFTSVLPAQVTVLAWCEMKKPSTWTKPATQTITVGNQTELTFTLTKRQPAVIVQTVSDNDTAVSAVTPRIREMLSDAMQGDSRGVVTLDYHDTEIWLRASAGHEQLLEQAGNAIAAIIDENTSRDVHPRIRPRLQPDRLDQDGDEPSPTTTVHFILDREEALRLAGLTAAVENITVAGRQFSLLDLASQQFVHTDTPGPVRIEADLPAGAWTTIAFPITDAPTAPVPVHFPKLGVGIAPIRNQLLRADVDVRGQTQPTIMRGSPILFPPQHPSLQCHYLPYKAVQPGQVPGRDPLPWRAVRSGERSAKGFWSATYAQPQDMRRLYGRIQLSNGHRSATFPMRPQGLAIEAVGSSVRVEPLSAERDTAWETLVCLGRLDSVDRSDVRRLSTADEPLLRLAAVYSCYANGFDELLAATIVDLMRQRALLPADLIVLWHAAAAVTGSKLAVDGHTPGKDVLDNLAAAPSIPFFQWGVSIGCTVAEHFGADALAAKLGWIEPRLSPESTVSAWLTNDE